ncbi:MAG TPA: radical SAM protein [Candidatus Binataceae bacterium]|nr:radical SAM protein [Candidatus Binataceae bacterium]
MFFRKRALERIARERVLYQRRPGGGTSVCVIYPNVYRVGMANLGFQAVYHIFESHPSVAADRAFLPDPDEREAIEASGEHIVSFERGRPLSDFDILAFSISFETDYLNVLAILRMAGIPLRRDARAEAAFPLIIAGGSAVFLNPEPIADFIDLFLIGEGEEMVPEFIARFDETRGERNRTQALAAVEGGYLPDWYRPAYDEAGRLARVEFSGPGDGRVSRRLIHDLNRFNTSSLILTDESVFGDMFLVEASRGCQWGCRFCAAGFMYRPIRYRSPEKLIAEARRGLSERDVVGLVGAEMASVPGAAEVAEAVADAGGRLSPSSLKADCISARLASALARNGNRSATVAPEAGSERMRKVINKNLSEDEILAAASMLVGEGVENLKLYFMVGLPEERDEDVLEIARLTRAIVERARASRQRIGRVTVSLNPFVPKPWTPFQWDPMEEPRSLKRKIAMLRARLGRIGQVELDAESPRDAYFQTLVSRGDRRVGRILERLDSARCRESGEIWHELQRIRRGIAAGEIADLPDPDLYVTRAYGHDEPLPWDFIDHHIYKRFLLSERRKAHREHQTKPCDVTRCIVCGAC